MALLPEDLGERAMLGDAGANALGALVGLAAATRLGRTGRLAALGTVVALTAASEKVSFTKVIAGNPVLNRIDMWGRRPAPAPAPRSPAGEAATGPGGGRHPVSTTARRLGQGVAGAAVLIAVITIAARVTGFGKQLAFARTVGTNCLATAYYTANQVPNLVFELVVGGALAGMVVPVLAGAAARSLGDGPDAARPGPRPGTSPRRCSPGCSCCSCRSPCSSRSRPGR